MQSLATVRPYVLVANRAAIEPKMQRLACYPDLPNTFKLEASDFKQLFLNARNGVL